MSQEIEYIEHDGRISAIDADKSIVTVTFLDNADCGACPASKICNDFSGDKNKVDIQVANVNDYKIGEFVNLRGTERLHRKAIMLATVIPSLALIVVMIGIYLLTANQLAACLSGLGAMIVFFVGLYLMRNRLAHEFTFQIIKTRPGEDESEIDRISENN